MATHSFLKKIQHIFLLAFFALTVFTCLVLAYGSYHQYQVKSQQLQDSYLEFYKSRLLNNIHSVRELANAKIRNVEDEIKEDVFYRVQEAIDIAYEIYASNNPYKNSDDIKNLIKDTLRAIRYNQASGYYFIFDLDQQSLALYPPDPRVEGIKQKDLDENWQSTLKQFKKIAQEYGDGFLKYRWEKANNPAVTSEKISFIKQFAPYNWFIGTGLHFDDFMKLTEDKIIKDVQTFHANDNNYLLFDQNKNILVGELNSTLANIQLLAPEQFHQIGNLLYYSAVIDEFGWTIGLTADMSGTYQSIENERQKYLQQVVFELSSILAATLLLCLLFFGLMKGVSSRIKANFSLFTQTFQHAAKTNQTIAADEINYLELTELGKTANEMIDENRKIKEGLEASREFLSLILNAVPSIIFTLSPSGAITTLNETAEQYVEQYRQQDKSPLRMLLKALNIGEKELSKSIDSATARSFPTQKVILADREFYYDVHLTPLSLRREIVVQIKDMTERVRLEDMMILSEKMMSIGGMAAGMAHEINNPLSIISQATQNTKRRISADLPANQKAAQEVGIDLQKMADYMDKRAISRFLADIQEAVGRTTSIVNNMLSFSATSSFKREGCSVADIITETLLLANNDYDLKKKYNYKNIQLETKIADGLPRLFVNKTEIEQVLFNLIKNAAQAMAEAGSNDEQPRIKITASLQKFGVKLTLTDNGPGIGAEIKKRIFEPFYTTKAPGVGTGLGLSVSYFIITNRHQGRFRVVSELGQGTTFVIELPVGELE